jgi:hypothetical protein
MAGPVKPVAKSVYVCDEVVGDPATGKVSLFNLWDTVRLPPGSPFPYCLAKLCVFVWWRDGLGKLKSRIDVVQASTGTVLRRTGDCILDFEERTSTIFARYRLEICTFPEAGNYYVEVYCQDEFVDDQLIQVIPG